MELRQLRYLVAVAEEGQFTRAAKREHVAQPSLSQQIAKLEEEVGLKLVDRTTRSVHLTEAGIALTLRARRILAELEAARAELSELSDIRSGRLSIGAMQTLGPFDLSLLLSRFHGEYPGVDLSVKEALSEVLAEQLLADQIEFAFLSMTDRIEGASQLLTLQVASEELVAVFSAEHPLASREEVRLEQLSGEDFIAFSSGASLRHTLNVICEEAGFTPRVVVESNEIPRIRWMVARGLGVSILPAADVEHPEMPIASARIARPRIARDVTLAWRSGKRLSPAASVFLEMARELSEELAPE